MKLLAASMDSAASHEAATLTPSATPSAPAPARRNEAEVPNTGPCAASGTAEGRAVLLGSCEQQLSSIIPALAGVSTTSAAVGASCMARGTACCRAVLPRLCGSKSLIVALACEAIASRNGPCCIGKGAKAQAMLLRCRGLKSPIVATASAAIASMRGTFAKRKTANDHAVFARCCGSHSGMRGRDADAIDASSARSRKGRAANAQAVFARSWGEKSCNLVKAALEIADSRGASSMRRTA
mmetsp:Transcript_164231/g.522292  ORF Transcript_164231/g.522292 Transcript_164231/m.522292 type:complete len:240 (-) Transcript_164231:768-1487(-)